MADVLRKVLIVLAILMCLHQGTSSMGIDIKILEHNGVIPKALKITCTPEQTDNCARKVLALQLARNNRTLATLQKGSNIFYDRVLQSNIKAEGHIDTDVTKSSLTVTFGNILMEDSGVYTCTMVYFDRQGHLHQDVASKNFTVESNNMYDVVRNLMGELSLIKKTLTDTKTTLQKQLTEQEMELKELKNQTSGSIDDIHEVVRHPTQEVKELKVERDDNHEAVRNLTQEVKELKVEKDNTHEVVRHLTEELSTTKKELKEYKAKTDGYIVKDSYKTAFTAAYVQKDKLKAGDTVVFSDVMLNIGDAYDNNTGIFTTKRSGLYVFHLVVWMAGSNDVDIYIKVNDKIVAWLAAWDSDKPDQSSVSIVLALQEGDEVKPTVKSIAEDKIYGKKSSLFTGFLLTLT